MDAVYARVETKGAPAATRPGPRVSPWTLGLLGLFGVIVLVLAREAMSTGRRARRSVYTAGGRRGWGSPPVIVPPMWGGLGGGRRGGGGGGFSTGGGSFGGGGASGSW